jgi:hypothetical protein
MSPKQNSAGIPCITNRSHQESFYNPSVACGMIPDDDDDDDYDDDDTVMLRYLSYGLYNTV